MLESQQDDVSDNLEDIESALKNLHDISALLSNALRPQIEDTASSNSRDHGNTTLRQDHESAAAPSPRLLSNESSIFPKRDQNAFARKETSPTTDEGVVFSTQVSGLLTPAALALSFGLGVM